MTVICVVAALLFVSVATVLFGLVTTIRLLLASHPLIHTISGKESE